MQFLSTHYVKKIMDEKFLDGLKAFSVQDMLEDQRPTTSSQRITTARQGFGRFGTAMSRGNQNQPDGGETVSTRGAGLRPDSAAFIFSLNRPKTGMMDTNAQTTGQPPPTARVRSRQQANSNNSNYWDLGDNGDAPVNRPVTGSISAFSASSGGSVTMNGGAGAFTGGRNSSSRLSLAASGLDDTVEYIPDLDDVQDEDLTVAVAEAPAYEIQRMTSLTELDAELVQSKPFSVVDGIDLRKLCRFLVPEKDLTEKNDVWDWDYLYTEIITSPECSHLVRFGKNDKESDIQVPNSFQSKMMGNNVK